MFLLVGDASGGVRLFKARFVRGTVTPDLQLSEGFCASTDTSDVAVSAVLHQDVSGALDPIAYHARVLTPDERNYSTCEKECLVVPFA